MISRTGPRTTTRLAVPGWCGAPNHSRHPPPRRRTGQPSSPSRTATSITCSEVIDGSPAEI
ncbi:hypothetical protein [Allokutzneria oryzae]|uniref:Uncharacterized protein n=1 Tax=Allokutzneria oryzae TaxID=1378989 RepID=A0ABV5ZQ21_9PSEU